MYRTPEFVRKLTIYHKLLLTFLVAIIPMYAISAMMNESGRESVRKELLNSMDSKVVFYLGSLEKEMNRVVQMKKEYISHDPLHKLSNLAPAMSHYERMDAILGLRRQLKFMKESSLYIEVIKLNIPMIGRTIYSNDNFDENLPKEEMKALIDSHNRSESPLFYWKGNLLISQLYPGLLFEGVLPAFAMEIVLSQKELSRSLLEMNKLSSGGAVLLDEKFAWTVANEKDSHAVPALKEYVLSLQRGKAAKAQGRIHMQNGSYFVTSQYSPSLKLYLLMYVPESEVLGPLNTYRNWFVVLSGISLFCVILISYWIHRLIHRPLFTLVQAFRKVEKGDLSLSLHYRKHDEFNYLYGQFNSMINRLGQLIKEVYEQKIRSQQSELKQLQSQINPHFLYNSYYVLYRILQNHHFEDAVEYTEKLGQYFRYITRTGQDIVTLEQEVKHGRAYADIQMMRFSSRMELRFEEVPEEHKLLRVPRLIIQPLLENAFGHGLGQKKSDGLVEVTFSVEDKYLFISVEDNGEELSEEALQNLKCLVSSQDREEVTGVFNVHRRLQLRFGNDCGLRFSRSKWGGLKAVLVLLREEARVDA